MTKEEQHRIDHLANLGEGYRCISRKLSLPENTVKSYLRRRKEPDTGICPYC